MAESSDIEIVSFTENGQPVPAGRSTRASAGVRRTSSRLQSTTPAPQQPQTAPAAPPKRKATSKTASSSTAGAAALAPAKKAKVAAAAAPVLELNSDSSEILPALEYQPQPTLQPAAALQQPSPQPRAQPPTSSASSGSLARSPPPPEPLLEPSPPSQHYKARPTRIRSPRKPTPTPEPVPHSPVASTSKQTHTLDSDGGHGHDSEADLDDFFTRTAPAAKPLRRPGQKKAAPPPPRSPSPEFSSSSEESDSDRRRGKKKARPRETTPNSSDDERDGTANGTAPWAGWKGKTASKSHSHGASSSPKKKGTGGVVVMSGADKQRAQLAKAGQASANRQREGRRARVQSEESTQTDATTEANLSADDQRTMKQGQSQAMTLSDSSEFDASADERSTKRPQPQTFARRRSSSPAEDSARIALERRINRLQQAEDASPDVSRRASGPSARAGRPESDSSDLEMEEALAPELQEARRKAKALRRQSGLEVVEQHGPVSVMVVMKLEGEKRAMPGWGPAEISLYEKPYSFTIDSNATLDLVYDTVARAKSLPRQELVLSFNFVEARPFAKPADFSFRAGSTFNLRAWHRHEFERYKADKETQRRDAPREQQPPSSAEQAAHGQLPTPPAAEEDGAAEDGPSEGRIRLTLRGGPNTAVGVEVRPTYTIQKLLAHYCKVQQIPPARQAKMWLAFDGDKLEPSSTVADCEDLEDEETVDVVEGK